MCFTGGYILALQTEILESSSSFATFAASYQSTTGSSSRGGTSSPKRSNPSFLSSSSTSIVRSSSTNPDTVTELPSSFSSLTIVISRTNEDITWLSYLTRLPSPPLIFVYNDGPPLESVMAKGMKEISGDHLPSECSKYLRYIIDHYDTLSPLTLFTQGDPFPHSPDFLGLLSSFSDWKLPVQPLSYRGHPYIIVDGEQRPWGPYDGLLNELWSDKFINNNRVYYEEMDEYFQGTVFNDPFISDYIHPNYWDIDKEAPQPFTITNLWKFFGITKPLPSRYYKAYAAIFGVSRHGIHRHPKTVYETMLRWLNTTANDNNNNNGQDKNNRQKARAIALEYMWPTIFGME